MNISVAMLGQEECKTCEEYRMHEHDDQHHGPIPAVDMEKLKERKLLPPVDGCTKCNSWAEHIVRAGIAEICTGKTGRSKSTRDNMCMRLT